MNRQNRMGQLYQPHEAPPMAPNLQVNELKDVQSFKQDKHLLKNEQIDITRPLSYEKAIDYVRTKLAKELTDMLEEESRMKQLGVILVKDKAYLRNRIADFQERIANVVYQDQLAFQQMDSDSFIQMAAAELAGYDVLTAAFEHPGVSDIFVYKWDKIYVECNGENQLYPYIFRNEMHYSNFIERLVMESEAKFDKGTNKISDFDLFQDRFCAVNSMIAPNGSSITIRKHSESHIQLNQIIKAQVMDDITAEFFRLILLGQCNLVYAGITGSGKTTTLRAMFDAYIAEANRRILVCEDTRELFLANPQTLELVSFKSATEGASVDLSDLVTTALRLKPKYILIGELRGAEALGAMEAAATGHSTSFSMHADKPIDAVNRLVINYQRAMPQLSSSTVERIVGEAMNFIAIQKHIPGVGRRVVSITEVGYDYEKGWVTLTPIMDYNYEHDCFEFKHTFSQDIINRMLGTGISMTEIKEWQKKAGVLEDELRD